MPKLLVVTPPGPNADELVGKLTDRGFAVARAATGSEALPAALRAPPDAILMDSALSAMDRWHAVKRLNAESRTARVPVLTLSSDAQSPAGLQRVLDKLEQTLTGSPPGALGGGTLGGAPAGGAEEDLATPVSASSRVASRRVAMLDSIPPSRISGPPQPAPDLVRPDLGLPTVPAGSIPPVKRPTPPSPPRAHVPPARLARTSSPPTHPPDPEIPGEAGRILVVDDNDLNRDMLSRRLIRRGYEVESVEDGERALVAIAARRFDLVLLDWMMPGLSGLDVLRRIREQHSSVQLPVIMATAKTEAEDVVQALQAEANDYVTKPLNFDVVHARVRTQLALVGAHRELLASERRYRALLENTGDMIVQYSLDGRVHYVSPASRTLLGLEPHELTARSWYDTLHPIDRRELLSQQDPRSLPTNFTYLARMGRKDGSWTWVETSCRVIRQPDTGVIQMIQAACRDVSEHLDRIAGDEPPLPLGGDIMAHPGWRASSTGEPAPPRSPPGEAEPSAPDAPAPPRTPRGEPPAPQPPVVIVATLPGLDPAQLVGLSTDEIGTRVADALRALGERHDG